MSSIELMDTREKLIYLRRTLKTTQRALAGDTLTKEFISMVEGGKRNMSREVAITVMKNALNLANEKGIDLGLDEEYLTRSKEDDLCEICDKLDNTMENMDNFNKIIEYAEENNYQWAKIMATKKIGNAYFVKEQFNKAYEKYIESLKLIDELRSNKLKEEIYNSIGNIKLKMSQYEEALIYYKESLNYCYVNNKINVIKRIQYNIALSLFNLNNLEESIRIINEALSETLNDELYLKFQLLKGSNYINCNCIEKSIKIYISLLENYKVSDETIIIIYNNLALCYMYKEQYDNSAKYFQLALQAAQFIPEMKYKIISDMGSMNKKIKNYKEAKKLFQEGLKLSEKTEDSKYKLRCLEELCLLEESQENSKETKKLLSQILGIARDLQLQNYILWARKKLIDIAIKENDLSILKEA